MANKHSFTTYIRNTHAFTIVTDLISALASWRLTVRLRKIKITINSITLQIKDSVTIRLRRVRITISSTLLKLQESFALTIRLRKIIISAIMHQKMDFPLALLLKKIIITPVMYLRTKLGSITIAVPKIAFTNIIVIAASFIALSVYDPQTLLAMDSGSLVDLDYVVT